LAELKTALNGADFTAIRAAQDKVARVSQEVGGAMYESAQAASAAAGDGATGGPSQGAGSSQAGDDTVVDAEVVDEGTEGDQK
jgi:molecular chaperone DnaK